MAEAANRVALITGGASGIGLATAKLLLKSGWRVAVVDRDESTLEPARQELGTAKGVFLSPLDVTDDDAAGRVVAQVVEALGGLDGVVNSAGIAADVHTLDTPVDLFRKILDVNVVGTFIVARAAARIMKDTGGGAIVNLASVTFYRGEALLVSYVASKGAVIGFTRALAREAGPDGIRVNAVAPGAFPTAATAIHADQDALWTGVLENQSLKRRGEVEDVARAIAFFAGDDSGFVTGQTLLVDGGWMRG